MSSGFDKIINNLLQILQEAGKNKTSPLDAQAEVRRVEGNTAWVHIAGGVDETPVRLTINARVGDKVQVRLSGGRAWITGNASAPPTDDHVANTANTTAKTANVTANQALQGANTAQNAADKAQSSADKAQNTATEAAKTADNYISTDSTGIMVSENNGSTKETPSNATKNNVLITEKDVQIRNGQKVLALYGENTVIGDQNGSNISISSDGVTVNDSGVKAATLKAIKNGWETVETRANFDGDSVNSAMQSEAIWTCDYALEGEVSGVLNVYLNGSSVDSLPILSVSDAAYGFTRSGDIVTIRIDGSIALAQITDWAQYTSVTITYVKWKDVTGVVASDEIHGVNCYIDNVYATNRLLAGAQCNLVSVNDVKKVLIVGNGDINKRANATAIMENGDIRILGDVYVGCREDSTGGVQLGKAMSVVRGDGTATANTGTIKSQPRWWRCGNIVQMEFTVAAKASVASGSNIATGKITGIPHPVALNGIRSVSYYGDNANVTFVSQDGGFTTRNCGKDALASGNDAIGSFTYITDGAML